MHNPETIKHLSRLVVDATESPHVGVSPSSEKLESVFGSFSVLMKKSREGQDQPIWEFCKNQSLIVSKSLLFLCSCPVEPAGITKDTVINPPFDDKNERTQQCSHRSWLGETP